jgi:hypothetical protein
VEKRNCALLKKSIKDRTDNTMIKRKCRKVQTMIYKIYTGLNYVYLKWSPGLPNFGGFFGDQNLNLLSPFLFTQLEISTAGTFSHVYVCTQHINTDQYRFYALNYLRLVTAKSETKSRRHSGKKCQKIVAGFMTFQFCLARI